MWTFMTPAQNAAYDRWEATWRNGPEDVYEEESPLEEEDQLFETYANFNQQDLDDIINALIAADYPENYLRLYRNAKPDQSLLLDNVDLHILIDALREHNPTLADDVEELLDEAREDYLKSKVETEDRYS